VWIRCTKIRPRRLCLACAQRRATNKTVMIAIINREAGQDIHGAPHRFNHREVPAKPKPTTARICTAGAATGVNLERLPGANPRSRKLFPFHDKMFPVSKKESWKLCLPAVAADEGVKPLKLAI
jgi:hypothetical protein